MPIAFRVFGVAHARARIVATLAATSTTLALGQPRRLNAQSASTIAITHVTVIPMTGSATLTDRTVLLRGDRIVAVGPSSIVRVPAGSRGIDGRGRYVVPGLWDMHAHVLGDSATRAIDFRLYVANGVTGIRNMIGDCDTLCADRDSAAIAPPASLVERWKREIAAGRLLGPRIVSAGIGLEGPPPKEWPQSHTIRDSADAVAAIALARAHHSDFIKIIGDVPPQAYFTILRTARTSGLPVAGHVPSGVGPLAASDSGQRSVEHLFGVREQCSTSLDSVTALRAARAQDTSTAHRAELTRAITHLLAVSFDEATCQPYFARLVRNQTWQVPTLSTQHEIGRLDSYVERDDPYIAYATTRWRREWKLENDPYFRTLSAADFASRRELQRNLLRAVGAMWRANVPLLAGTDVWTFHIYPGFAVHQELSYLVDAGLTPRAALEAATIAPARYFGATDSLGTVAEGKLADLVLVDADPLVDIRNLSRISAVVLHGRVLERRELDRLLQEAREYAKAH
jgi:imidazolonepropionase-like amidohydrolase